MANSVHLGAIPAGFELGPDTHWLCKLEQIT